MTPITPRSWTLIATPPTSKVLFGNGLGKTFSSGPQIHAASPFRITSSAIVAITIVSGFARSIGRITTRWIATPPPNAIAIVTKNAGQYEKPWCSINDHAM